MTQLSPEQPQTPWSPYPVQDWSALPHDPLQSAELSGPDRPAAGPPARTRKWWPPLLVFVLIAALISGLAYLGSAVGLRAAPVPAARYLPADGSAAYERLTTTRETTTTEQLQVTESARLHGAAAILASDFTFGVRAFAGLFDEASTLDVWRTITTPVAAPEAGQTTRIYHTNAGVALLGESRPDGAYIYAPALIELPADPGPGRSWTSAGSASQRENYRADYRASAAADNCLQVTGEIRYTDKAGTPRRTIGVTRTWCPGRGIVASSAALAPVRVVVSQVPAPQPPAVRTTADPVRWTDPAGFRSRALTTASNDPTFGPGEMNGGPASLPPVGLASGVVVRGVVNANDLVGLQRRTPTSWTSIWRVHAPGTILTLTGFGDVFVVTTSARVAIGYSGAGVRLWQLQLDELAPAAPARLSDTEAVLVDLSGQVRAVDLRTGAIRWQQGVGADVRLSPAVGAGQVVVLDQGGTVTALAAATGESRWTRELAGKAAVVSGDTVVVVQDQTAHALAPETGATRWRRPVAGTLTGVTAFGDRLVLASKTATVLYAGDGSLVARSVAAVGLTATQDHLVVWGTDRASVLDRTGAVAGDWALPPLTLALQIRPAVAEPAGVLLFGSDWQFSEWSR